MVSGGSDSFGTALARHLSPPSTHADGNSVMTAVAVALSRSEALDLTREIREQVDRLYLLLERAHAGRVWLALDYPSWEAWLRQEFQISRQRGYQLLGQASAVRALASAMPEGSTVHLSEAAARDLRPVLDGLSDAVRDATEGMTPDQASEELARLVVEFRDRLRAGRSVGSERTPFTVHGATNVDGPDDEWYTPDHIVERGLVPYLRPRSRLLACFDTSESAFVRVPTASGHQVTHHHINDGPGGDFFALSDEYLRTFDVVASNPPFSQRGRVLEKLFNSGANFLVLLGVAGLHEASRFSVFARNAHRLETLYFSRRVAYQREFGPDATPAPQPPYSSVFVGAGVLGQPYAFVELP